MPSSITRARAKRRGNDREDPGGLTSNSLTAAEILKETVNDTKNSVPQFLDNQLLNLPTHCMRHLV